MSSTILTVIVLVVMWLVVLVPMFVRRADEPVEPAGDDSGEAATSTRALARRALTGHGLGDDTDLETDLGTDFGTDGDGDVHGDGDGRSDRRGAAGFEGARFGAAGAHRDLRGLRDLRDLRDGADGLARSEDDPENEEVSGDVDADEFEELTRPSTARARMIARRRRALAILAGLTLGALVTVALTRGQPAAWAVQVGCDLLLVGYLVGLRGEARRERVRRTVRAARAARVARAARAAAVRAEAQQAAALRAERANRAGRVNRAEPSTRTDPSRRTQNTGSTAEHRAVTDEPDDPMERRRVV